MTGDRIVHAAGAIPTDVEHAITQQLDQRRTARRLQKLQITRLITRWLR